MLLPTRPVLAGFHPDPSVCRVGESFYLVCSSFEYAPGVPIFQSTDLRSWHLIGNVLDRPSQLDLKGAVPSGGIFAPTLRHHGGRFWMITTNMTDRRGHLLVHAKDPAGPWSEPVRIEAPGIDPDLAWDDDDGTCYMTWAGFSHRGPEGIRQVVLDPVSGTLLSEPRTLWQGTGGKFPEGPHLYRIGDHWYLLIAEGGTERGHAATIARASGPGGPFEPSPRNPVVTARGSDTTVQNTGHADLVQRADGSWAMLYLGIRARGASPEWHVLGRETFASEIQWKDGWPSLGDPIQPPVRDAVSESLIPGEIPPSWVSPGRFPSEVVDILDTGWRLTAPDGEAVFVGRRQEHMVARVVAELDVASGEGGLELRIDPRHSLRVHATNGRVRAVASIGTVESDLGETHAESPVTLELRITPSTGSPFGRARGPDDVLVGLVRQGEFVELGRLDGRYLSTEVASGMTGRMVGVSCGTGSVIVRNFDYTGSDPVDPNAPRN